MYFNNVCTVAKEAHLFGHLIILSLIFMQHQDIKIFNRKGYHDEYLNAALTLLQMMLV